MIFERHLLSELKALKWAIPSSVLCFILFFNHVFTHSPCSSMGLQTDFFSSFSSSFSFTSHLQLIVATWLKKAQVLFLPGWQKLKFLFLLGTENAVGGHGSLAVYAILFLPTPLAVVWVNILTFSSPPSPPPPPPSPFLLHTTNF